MKNKMHILFTILLSMVMSQNSLKAELLILKQTSAGFVPLDDSDKDNISKIQDILLKYQWTMSAAFALLPDAERSKVLKDTGDLFLPNKPRAEEIWIETTIRKINDTYRVIFFPTTLYELTVCQLSMSKNRPDYLQPMDSEDYLPVQLWLNNNDSSEVRKKIMTRFSASNRKFMTDPINVHYTINQKIIGQLFEWYPELKSIAHSEIFSNTIQTKSLEIYSKIYQAIETDPVKDSKIFKSLVEKNGLSNEESTKIVEKFIALEYEARSLNKGILIRGTTFEKFNSPNFSNETKYIAGSTVLLSQQSTPDPFAQQQTEPSMPFDRAYMQNSNKPYSISFGNSLFAGILKDRTACAYLYLVEEEENNSRHMKSCGYALLINKYEYIKTQNNNLFFISSLSTLAALCASGEYFHSRSKAAIAKKTNPIIKIGGLAGYISDPTNMILIERDPLQHAALFSKCIAENGRILQWGDESSLTAEEKEFADQVLKTQKETAGYYVGIKGAKKFINNTQAAVKKKKSESTKLTIPEKQEPFPLRALRQKQEEVSQAQALLRESKTSEE